MVGQNFVPPSGLFQFLTNSNPADIASRDAEALGQPKTNSGRMAFSFSIQANVIVLSVHVKV